jgi:hypothetical protein
LKKLFRRGHCLAGALAVVLLTMSLTVGQASAADNRYGGVEALTATGKVLTGPAAIEYYEQSRRGIKEQGQCTERQNFSGDMSGLCSGAKVVVINAMKMPFIARNINKAISEEDYPMVLNRVDPAQRQVNYTASCMMFVKKYRDGSCDEYPFASSRQGGLFGGRRARTEEVPRREQNCQGGTISRAYQQQNIVFGEEYGVVLIGTNSIPSGPYIGEDVAKDPSCDA